MTVVGVTESVVEEAALGWLAQMGYTVLPGPDIAPGELHAEREGYDEVVLADRLRAAIDRLNPNVPAEGKEDALRKVTRVHGPSLVATNRAFHKMLTDGVDVEYRGEDGRVVGDKVWLFDFDEPGNDDFLAVNQFTVTEDRHTRRPDVVVFVNGLPLVVIELKNPADETATIWTAFKQLQTYKAEIPSLFAYNEVLVVSDALEAQLGSLTADREWFMPWRTVEGEKVAPVAMPQLQVLLAGLLEKHRLLEYVRHFVLFEDERERVAKKIAGYHQFHAVRKAVDTTVEASRPDGGRHAASSGIRRGRARA